MSEKNDNSQEKPDYTITMPHIIKMDATRGFINSSSVRIAAKNVDILLIVKRSNLANQISVAFLSLLVVILLDLALPHTVGFLELAAMPYVALLVGVAFFSGSIAAIAAGAAALLWIIAVGPLVVTLVPARANAGALPEIPHTARYGAAVLAVIGILAVNRVHRLYHDRETDRSRIRELSDAAESARLEAHALRLIHLETRNRLATERSSITILYEQIQRLQSIDQNQVLEASLAAMRLMTGATSCVIYRFREESLELERIAVWPTRHDARYPRTKPVSSSIEGYVVRTGALFSLRHLIDHPELRELEENRSAICAPVVVGNQIWGVLTVGRIPFLYYNEHAEKALQITAAIVAPALDQAIPLMAIEGASDSAEMLHRYDEFLDMLEEKLLAAREMDFHVMLLLVELQSPLEFDQQLELSGRVGEEIASSLGRGVAVFQYQQPNQLALISVSVKSEAAGYLLLRVTDLVGSKAWTVGGDTVMPSVFVGFGTSAQRGYESAALLESAESMLSIYRRSRR